jgi:hypothetical protein
METICKNCAKDYEFFYCAKCNKHIINDFQDESYNNVCQSCASKLSEYQKKCTYCNIKSNLWATNYSSCCSKCKNEKNAKICVVCKQLTLYSKNSYGKYGVCTTDDSKIKHVLEAFKFFMRSSEENRNMIKDAFDKQNEKTKEEILDMYFNTTNIFKNKELENNVKEKLGLNVKYELAVIN